MRSVIWRVQSDGYRIYAFIGAQSMADRKTRQGSEIGYQKIGGWLILCAIGLVLYPVQTMVSLITELIPALSPENWSVLTAPASTYYHPFFAHLVIVELVGNILFLIFSICLVVFFFQQRKYAPKLIILFFAVNLIFVGFDYFVTTFFIIRPDSINMEAAINFIRTTVASLVWIPYFMFSKRVKNTFVK
jgi:hypothetical protein